MALNAALNNETICDLSGQPLDRKAASFLKAIDKLLTVGAYYSSDHEQYRVVSEKACELIVEAIGRDRLMAIEITAAGMMVASQLVDPHHRNVRLLYDLLVPLNVARFEISAALTPADLRQAVSALQNHKMNLGNTTGFQEIKIENLPPTVSTASKSVVRDDGRVGGPSVDDILGSFASTKGGASGDRVQSESERLAGCFMEIVAQILANLEKKDAAREGKGSGAHPDLNSENLRALRVALQRLVEVNPDPADLARLIEHAKRALDLSHDPRSVDLVFSMLKNEVAKGSDWKDRAREIAKNKPKKEYRLSLEELTREVFQLGAAGRVPDPPGPSSLSDYLGICFHLLGGDPAEALQSALDLGLHQAITKGRLSPQDLDLCSSAVADSVLKGNQAALDRVLPAFCPPLRAAHPDQLAKFWTRQWEPLDPEHRALVWPHLVNDLLLGLGDAPDDLTENLWRAVGQLDTPTALAQISRLEDLPALRQKPACPGLMKLPLAAMYPVHLALMNSSLAPHHGPRIHYHLRRDPPNAFIEILMKALALHDPDNDDFFLSLIRQSSGPSMTMDLRRQAARLMATALSLLPAADRNQDWVDKALGWIGRLDPLFALDFAARVRREKRYFFFRAWPQGCREVAARILAAATEDDAKDRG